MDELLIDFLAETGESLTALDDALLQLERVPDDPDMLALVFRMVHTIKGTCGFLSLPRLERVAHAAEDLLSEVRDGALPANAALITVVLKALDRIKLIVAGIVATGLEPEGDDRPLVDELSAIRTGAADAPTPAPEPADAEAPLDVEPTATANGMGSPAQTIRLDVSVLENLMTLVSELVLTRNQLMQLARTEATAATPPRCNGCPTSPPTCRRAW